MCSVAPHLLPHLCWFAVLKHALLGAQYSSQAVHGIARGLHQSTTSVLLSAKYKKMKYSKAVADCLGVYTDNHAIPCVSFRFLEHHILVVGNSTNVAQDQPILSPFPFIRPRFHVCTSVLHLVHVHAMLPKHMPKRLHSLKPHTFLHSCS